MLSPGQPASDSRDDRGFTLIELLVTITLVSVIAFSLCAMVITYMKNAETIRSRQTESKDQQIAAVYWSSDVGSVGKRPDTTTFAPSNGVNTGDCTGYPGTKLISFQWTTFNFTSASPPVVTSVTTTTTYSLSGTTLVRTTCGTGAPRSMTIANTVQADAAHPIQCSTDGGTYAACPSMSGSGSSGVYMKFYVADASGKGQGYWATLVGERRQTP